MKLSDKQPDAPAVAPATEQPLVTAHEYATYQVELQRIAEDDPELVSQERANELKEGGYKLPPIVEAQIIKELRPDVAAYLLSDRGQADRCALQNAEESKSRALAEYERIKGFVSRNGLYAKPEFVRSENAATDEYLVQRRRDFMHGIRKAR